MSDTELDIEDMLRRIESNVQAKYAPIASIGKEIIDASVAVRDKVKPFIPGTEIKKIEREAYVFFEAIWFWTHIASHQIFHILPEQQIDEAVEFLGKALPETAIDSYFGHWDTELKRKMLAQFVDNLNTTESEYSQSRERYALFGFDGIFLDFARKLVDQCELKDQWEHIRTPLVEIIEKQWKWTTFRFSQIEFRDFYIEVSDGSTGR